MFALTNKLWIDISTPKHASTHIHTFAPAYVKVRSHAVVYCNVEAGRGRAGGNCCRRRTSFSRLVPDK